MAAAGKKRAKSGPSDAQSRKRQCKIKPPANRDSSVLDDMTFRQPSNPQATLCGLPAELRLEIFSHLCSSTLIHVHHHQSPANKTSWFTWTPCFSPHPSLPLLCANPKWSGLCIEEDRCTYKISLPPSPRGFWALAASCKSIRNETQGYFMRGAVISIHPQALKPWLNHLNVTAPHQLRNIYRLTLEGPNLAGNYTNWQMELIRSTLPNLSALGVQCQERMSRWRYGNDGIIEDYYGGWQNWAMVDMMRIFQDSLTIAMEASVWRKHHPRWSPEIPEQQFTVRIFRKGKTRTAEIAETIMGSAWSAEDVEMQIDAPGKLVACKRNAPWRQWWRSKEMKAFG